MYIRYRAKYYDDTKDQIGFGFFAAAENLKAHGSLSKADHKKLEELIYFFDHQLPIPDYYQKKKNRQGAKSATSWFKDTASNFIARMNELAKILTSHNVEVERINSKKIPGKKIYEDEFQITVVPFREIANKIK